MALPRCSAATISMSCKTPPARGGASGRLVAARTRKGRPARAQAPAAPSPYSAARRVIMRPSLHRGRIVQAVGALDLDLQSELGHERLDRAGLGDKAVDHVLHDLVALGIALADHL